MEALFSAQAMQDIFSKIGKDINSLSKRAKTMEGRSVTIGVEDEAQYENGTKVADVANWLEYGTRRMAPRAFMRQTVDGNEKKWTREIDRRIATIVEGKGSNYKQMLDAVGNMAKEDVQKTIKGKGMIRTGTLLRSMRAEVA